MNESAVTMIVRKSRKVRKQTTCYPCQLRKVKCDRKLPCSVCVVRGHSHVCSYARPTATSNTVLPTLPALERNHEAVDPNVAPISATNPSSFQRRIDHLTQELEQARATHGKCEAVLAEVVQLREHCRGYEAVFARLNAGDRSALVAFDRPINSDCDIIAAVSSEPQAAHSTASRSIANSSSPIDQAESEDAPLYCGTFRGPGTESVGRFDLDDTKMSTTGLPRTSPFRPATVEHVLGDQTSHLSSRPRSQKWRSEISRRSSTGSNGHEPPLQYMGAVEGNPRPPVSSAIGHFHPLHQNVDSAPQQSQRQNSVSTPDDHHDATLAYHSRLPGQSFDLTTQGPLRIQGARYSAYIQVPNSVSSRRALEPVDTAMSLEIAWAGVPSYPPMMFTPDTSFVEHSYADYCSRITLEARRVPL